MSFKPTFNGSEFQAGFHWHVLDRGIQHVYIKPATPRLNGKVERSHRIDAEEFYRLLGGVVIDDTQLFNDKLQQWENFYNFERPHGSLAGLQIADRGHGICRAAPSTQVESPMSLPTCSSQPLPQVTPNRFTSVGLDAMAVRRWSTA